MKHLNLKKSFAEDQKRCNNRIKDLAKIVNQRRQKLEELKTEEADKNLVLNKLKEIENSKWKEINDLDKKIEELVSQHKNLQHATETQNSKQMIQTVGMTQN